MPCMHRQTEELAVLQAWPCLHDSWDKGVLHCAGRPRRVGAGTHCVGRGERHVSSRLRSLQCTKIAPNVQLLCMIMGLRHAGSTELRASRCNAAVPTRSTDGLLRPCAMRKPSCDDRHHSRCVQVNAACLDSVVRDIVDQPFHTVKHPEYGTIMRMLDVEVPFTISLASSTLDS